MAQFSLRTVRIIIILLIFANCMLVTADSANDEESKKLMVKILGRAFTMACKQQFSTYITREYCVCTLRWLKDCPPPPDFYARRINRRAPNLIPRYHQQCASYTEANRTREAPPVDESAVLQDKGLEYGLKAYAHCLVSTVKKIAGEEAVMSGQGRPKKSKKRNGW